jgi:adenosine deaminase
MTDTHDTPLSALIAALPKAELHLHIEGSLEPELMFALAKRNNVAIPFASVEEVRAAYSFSQLQDFLDIYYAGADVLRTQQDFHDLAAAYFERAAADNIAHAEIFFDPQTHTDRGIGMDVVMGGLLSAMKQAESVHGISSGLILCFLRHLSEEAALETLAQAEPWVEHLTGVGLDSSEVGHPPAKFERVFARAGELGLKRVAHAGEEGPPAYVHEALDLLAVDRLDHGNRAMEDPALVQRLADSGMALTVCPLSNLKLCVVEDMGTHPIPAMLAAGLTATVNSDDPAYFGGYVNDNFRALDAAGVLTRDGLIQLVRNSFTGSFLSEAEKDRHLKNIDKVIEQSEFSAG